jgi:hypothetical protein
VPGATIQVGDDAALLPVSITVTTSSTAETARAEIVFTLGPDSIVTNRPPQAVAALLERGSTAQAPVVSDLLFASQAPATIPGGPVRARFSFDFDSSSNVEGQPLPAGIPAANVFVENGHPQIIFTTTLRTSVGDLPVTIIALSDDVEAVVPEPSTLLLFTFERAGDWSRGETSFAPFVRQPIDPVSSRSMAPSNAGRGGALE